MATKNPAPKLIDVPKKLNAWKNEAQKFMTNVKESSSTFHFNDGKYRAYENAVMLLNHSSELQKEVTKGLKTTGNLKFWQGVAFGILLGFLLAGITVYYTFPY
jgi:hypothetical protein